MSAADEAVPPPSAAPAAPAEAANRMVLRETLESFMKLFLSARGTGARSPHRLFDMTNGVWHVEAQ